MFVQKIFHENFQVKVLPQDSRQSLSIVFMYICDTVCYSREQQCSEWDYCKCYSYHSPESCHAVSSLFHPTDHHSTSSLVWCTNPLYFSKGLVYQTTSQIVVNNLYEKFTICNLISENRPSCHIQYFEKTDFKYSSHCSSLVLDCSHPKYTV